VVGARAITLAVLAVVLDVTVRSGGCSGGSTAITVTSERFSR
jgi:hypothetical protein